MLFDGAWPAFDLDNAGLFAALARSLFVAALFSAYGSLLYRVRLAGATLRLMPGRSGLAMDRRYDRLSLCSLAAALAGSVLWLAVQAWVLFAPHGAGGMVQALGDTLSTSFGHILGMQAAFLAIALGSVLAARRNATLRDIAVGCAGVAVLLQGGHGHGASMYDGFSVLLVSELAHLMAGAAWLGSLLPLLMTVRHAPPSVGYAAASRFSRFGAACVVVLAATALFQGWQLVGGVPGLVGTAYGWLAMAKTGLFVALLCMAASNRYRLTPALTRSGGDLARGRLVRSIALETGFGMAILVAASILVTLPPSIHEQPVWPFTVKPSLVTVLELPQLFGRVVMSLFGLVIALSILAAGLAFRKVRWPAMAVAAIIAWFAVPNLRVLFVEAYPTSFYHSTTNFAATSIAAGAALFPGNCASCHGAEGRGDGPLAASLPEPPADLTAGHLWAHADGELFWWLTDGIKSPEGEQAMPGFGAVLSEEDRWNLIDYIRANNAGTTYAATGSWSPNVQGPKFQATCNGQVVTSDDLKGRVVRLVFADTMPAAPARGDVADRLVTVLASGHDAATDETHCLAQDPAVARAYAIVSGIPQDRMQGTEFLIDPNGWLRAVQKPGESISWNDPGALADQVVQLCNHPIAASAVDHSHHHH